MSKRHDTLARLRRKALKLEHMLKLEAEARMARDTAKPWERGHGRAQARLSTSLTPLPPPMRVSIRKGNKDWLMDQRPRGGHYMDLAIVRLLKQR